MSRKYLPDAWVVVNIESAEASYSRVLAGWFGGFAGSDSWKLSSGITRIEDLGDKYVFHNHSGSEYHCNKNAERLTGLTGSIYAQLQANTNIKVEGVNVEKRGVGAINILVEK